MRRRNTALSGEWAVFQLAMGQAALELGLSVEGAPELFLTIERVDRQPRASRSTPSYGFPTAAIRFATSAGRCASSSRCPQCHRRALGFGAYSAGRRRCLTDAQAGAAA